MSTAFSGYRRILAATDFTPAADAAIHRAVWMAHQRKSPLVIAHVLADLHKAVARTSNRARIEFLEGHEERFQREMRRSADDHLHAVIDNLHADDLHITYETLLGEPHVELIHTVQKEQYDLVFLGSKHSFLERLGLGGTARKMIRQCPASVWIVREGRPEPPATVVVAVDFSDPSARALEEAGWIAKSTDAKVHVVHVIEADDIPTDLLDLPAAEGPYGTLRELIDKEAWAQLDQFLSRTSTMAPPMEKHVLWGRPSDEIINYAAQVKADLVAMGTMGRGGIEGLLLGNTAETVLSEVACDILAVKPREFVSPVMPATWQLHPGPAKEAGESLSRPGTA